MVLWDRGTRLVGNGRPSLDCPDPALNAAVAWAIRRVGGQLRADPGPPLPWDDDDHRALIDDAREWHRVRSDQVLDPHEFLSRVVGGLLGVSIDENTGRLTIRPSIPSDWRSTTVRRLRAYRSLFDLELRPRAEWFTVRLELVFGPALPVMIALPSRHNVTRVTADEVPLESSYAIITAQGEHEVVLFTG